ncbi:MAG TPA: type VI secretion system protein TssA [Bryobacteraceae bacterium]|nr:type VI secretion system protein TssA [Bryobacteraceae bacterium]
MPLSDEFLQPIPGENPSGVNLYSTPLFEEVREARRQGDTGPQGLWVEDVKMADYDAVIRLTTDALTKKTKDLFLASWLADALLNKRGFAGLNDGIQLMQGLINQFWDTLYPEMEDGDAEFRASPLDWFGNYLEPGKGSSPALAVKTVPITTDGLNWLRYSESRGVPTQEQASASESKRTAREKALKEGKLAPEEADASVDQSPKAFYVKLHKDIAASLASLKALAALSDEKFGNAAPSFGKLQSGLTEVATTAGIILKKKRELEPDTEAEVAAEAAAEGAAETEPAPAAPSALGEILNRDDAVAHILAGVQFLRSKEPLNPAGYLVARALRWGELRAAGPAPDPKALVAAPADLRTQIKSLALEAKWPELLEACERASNMACGRGWLDMQRYAIRACEELGEPYQALARALKSELRALLVDYPQLPEMFLMDDTPTANLETQKWLRTAVLNSERLLNPLPGAQNGDAAGVYERALEAANAGNTAEAIDTLTRELAQSNSGRSRFLRKVELAQLLMSIGKDAVAYPILKELVEEVSSRKLEEWEAPSLVARPLALMYKCMAKLKVDAGQMDALHTRICKLDVAQALSCLE